MTHHHHLAIHERDDEEIRYYLPFVQHHHHESDFEYWKLHDLPKTLHLVCEDPACPHAVLDGEAR